ncbi:hypothetical protein NL676_014694 [Syzygium grande]|nr:hypothetical protein NL676_014694 [Syzygium grande]
MKGREKEIIERGKVASLPFVFFLDSSRHYTHSFSLGCSACISNAPGRTLLLPSYHRRPRLTFAAAFHHSSNLSNPSGVTSTPQRSDQRGDSAGRA